MKTSRAKVLHRLCGTSMIRLAVERAMALRPKSIVVVIGAEADQVRQELEGFPVRFAHQRRQLGTGHAVKTALGALKEASGHVLILYADTPLLSEEDLRRLLELHQRSRSTLSLLTAEVIPARHYGRILRAPEGRVVGIVEARDATPEQLAINEFNPGIYCVRIDALRKLVPRLRNRNAQKEYLLTDLLGLVSRSGERIADIKLDRPDDVLGINTLQELASASERLRHDKLAQLMSEGVTVVDPKTTYVDWHCRVGRDVTLHPQVVLEGKTDVAAGCVIRSFSRITDCVLGEEVTVLEASVLTDSQVGAGSSVGPGAHIRGGSVIGRNTRIGNYVEVKNTRFGDGSKAAHLTYLGDAVIGEKVNIGAGTITCNYDGVHKNQTIIEDGVFIGSNSALVAPLRIGTGAYVAAGSTITEDVPPYALAIARGRQALKPEWARDRLKKH